MSTYIAAYALASLAKPAPTAQDVEAILKASNIPVDKDALDFIISSIGGRSTEQLIAEGAVKLSQSSAPAAAAAPAAGGAAAAAAPAGGKAAKKEEPVEEDDDEMGFGLFD